MLPGCSETKACSKASCLADTHTLAPCACKALAHAKPMPLDAPTSHTLRPRHSVRGLLKGVSQAMLYARLVNAKVTSPKNMPSLDMLALLIMTRSFMRYIQSSNCTSQTRPSTGNAKV